MASDVGDAPQALARDKEIAQGAAPRDESAVTLNTVTINRPAAELYGFWRDFPNLASIMENIESITPVDDRTTHWAVKAPGGRTVEWDAVVTDDQPNHRIGWESAEGSEIKNSGWIEFREAGERGTIVRAMIAYDPPAGPVGQLVAKLLGREPQVQGRRELRRFKMLMETGEIANSTSSRAEPHKY